MSTYWPDHQIAGIIMFTGSVCIIAYHLLFKKLDDDSKK